MNYFQTLLHDALHVLAPSLCPACDAPVPYLVRGVCDECRASLPTAPYPDDLYSEIVERFGVDDVHLDAIGSLYNYEQDSRVQQMIHAFKYRGARHLARELGRDLGGTLSQFALFAGIDTVCAVPLHRARMRTRGFNQAAEVALGCADAFEVECIPDLLSRTANTVSQTTLDAGERRANVSDAFETRATTQGRRIMICDDVFTTGSTLNASASVLKLSGARYVVAATVARDVSP